MPAISSDVATGRRMNGRDGLMRALPPAVSGGRRVRSARTAARRRDISTLLPSCSLSCPSITTVSPPLRPLVDRRVVAFGHADRDRPHRRRLVRLDDVDEGPCGPRWMAASGHDHHVVFDVEQQPAIDELVRKQSASSLFEDALRREVPVVGSIWLSTVSSVPVASLFRSSRS